MLQQSEDAISASVQQHKKRRQEISRIRSMQQCNRMCGVGCKQCAAATGATEANV